MASPVAKNFTQAVLSDAGTATSPSDTSIGDLVVCFVWSQFTTTATTHTPLAGYSLVRSHSHNDSTTCGRLSVATKVATAAGAVAYTPFTIASATAGQTCAGIITVTGANSISPSTWNQGSTTSTNNQPPDPPALTGLNSDVLVMSIAAWSVTTAGATTTTPPTNYTAKIDGPTGTHLTHLAVSTRALTGLNNATEDPAAFGDNVAPNGTAAMTIAIPITSTYYVTSTGNDANLGTGTSTTTAWKTLTPVNGRTWLPGERVLFAGGQTFTGGLYIHNVASTQALPLTLDSYGTGRATISSAVGTTGCFIYQQGGTVIQNINFTGPGIATANKDGISFWNDAASTTYNYVRIDNCNCTGFVNGISLGGGAGTSGYNDVRITNCICNSNSKNGINVFGPWGGTTPQYCNANVYIGNCTANSNTGTAGAVEPTGSGIQIGQTNVGTIEYCIATGNGAANTYASGPIGIWAWECKAVIIQKCESYNNLSNGGDGGGFDLDGGCTNCIMQYNYSHGNKGGGLGIFQFAGASPFSGNIVRYNISENDQAGGISIWGADSSSVVTNTDIYNNTIFNSVNSTFRVLTGSTPTGITVKNNIFITTSNQFLVDYFGNTGITLSNNNYYAQSGTFIIWWNNTQYNSVAAFARDAAGLSVDPILNSVGAGGTVNNPANLAAMTAYRINSGASGMVNSGVTISSPGTQDFYGQAIYNGAADRGAFEYYVVAQNYTKSLADPASMGDAVARAFTYRRALADPAALGEVRSVFNPTGDYVRFYPRGTWASRMTGGIFEGTNGDPVAGTYTTLYTIPTQPPDSAWSAVNASLGSYRYYRYRGPNGGYCNVAEVEFYRAGVKLTGTAYGTAPYSAGSEFDKAFDANPATYFDSATADGGYAGIDTGPGATAYTKSVADAITVGETVAKVIPAVPVITTGLAAYWKLDEASGNRLDSSGLGSTLVQSSTVVNGAAGKVGQGANFVSVNNTWLTCASNSNVETGDVDYTITGWFKLNSSSPNTNILSKSSADSWEYGIYIDASGIVHFYLERGAYGDFSNYAGQDVPWTTAISAGTWCFFTAIHDSVNDVIKLSLNNGAFEQAAFDGGADIVGTLNFGNDITGTRGTNGLLDEVGLWKRVLSASEITQLYNSGAGLTYPFTPSGTAYTKSLSDGISVGENLTKSVIPAGGPSYPYIQNKVVAYWKLDETAGDRIDSSGGSCTLQINNAAVGGATGKVNGGANFVIANNAWLRRYRHSTMEFGDSDFTIAGWVKFGVLGVTNFIAKDDPGAGRKEYVLSLQADNKIHFTFTADLGGGVVGATYDVAWPTTVSTGNWYYVVGIHDSVNNLWKISVNGGTPVTTATGGSFPIASYHHFNIGANSDGVGRLTGVVDEVCLWRRAITDLEIVQIYNSGIGLTYPFATGGFTYTNPYILGNTGVPQTSSGHNATWEEGLARDSSDYIYAVRGWDELHYDIPKRDPANGNIIWNTYQVLSGHEQHAVCVEPDGSWAYTTGTSGQTASGGGTDTRSRIWRFNLAAGIQTDQRRTDFTTAGYAITVYDYGVISPSQPSTMREPLHSIVVSGSKLWVTDKYGGRLLSYDKVSGGASTAVTGLPLAQGLTVDASGNLWVAYNSNVIRCYNSAGTLIDTTTMTGEANIVALSIVGTTLAVAYQKMGVKTYTVAAGKVTTQLSSYGQPRRPGDNAPDRITEVVGMVQLSTGEIIMTDRVGFVNRVQKLNGWVHLAIEFTAGATFHASQPNRVVTSSRNFYDVATDGSWTFMGNGLTEDYYNPSYFGWDQASHGGPPRLLKHGSNFFFYYPNGASIAVYRVIENAGRGPSLQLCSCLCACGQPGMDGSTTSQPWLDQNRVSWQWTDPVGDGVIRSADQVIYSQNNPGTYIYANTASTDYFGNLWIRALDADALVKIPMYGLNSIGNPIYRWQDKVTVFTRPQIQAALGISTNVEFQLINRADGDVIIGAKCPNEPTWPQGGGQWMGYNAYICISDTGTVKWAKPAPRWSIGLAVIDNAGGGGFLNGDNDPPGCVYHFDKDGNEIKRIRPDARFGADLDGHDYPSGGIDSHQSINTMRDSRDGELKVFVADNMNQHVFAYSINDSAVPPAPPSWPDAVAGNKRGAYISLAAPYRRILPLSDGAITIPDRWQVAYSYFRQAGPLTLSLADGILIGDIRGGAGTFKRSIAEAAVIAELVSKVMQFVRTVTDPLIPADSLSKSMQFRRSMGDPVAMGEALLKFLMLARGITDPIAMGEVLAKSRTGEIARVDGIGATDTLARVLTAIRNVSNTVDVTDRLNAAITSNRAPSEAIVIGEALTKLATFIRSFSEPLTMSDVMQKLLVGGGPLVQNITNGMTIGETVAVFVAFFRMLNDGVFLNESFSKSMGFGRPLSDIVVMNDAMSKVGSFKRLPSDPITVAEAVTKVFGRPTADSIAIGEALSRVWDYRRLHADPITVAENLKRVWTYARTLGDAVVMADAINRSMAYLRQVGDPVGMAETFQTAFAYSRRVFDPMTLATAVVTKIIDNKTILKDITDYFVMGDVLKKVATFVFETGEFMGFDFNDYVYTVADYKRTYTDPMVLSDKYARIANFTRSTEDSISLAERLARVVAYARGLSDSTNVLDTAKTATTYRRSWAEKITLADALKGAGQWRRSLADPMAFSEWTALRPPPPGTQDTSHINVRELMRWSAEMLYRKIFGYEKLWGITNTIGVPYVNYKNEYIWRIAVKACELGQTSPPIPGEDARKLLHRTAQALCEYLQDYDWAPKTWDVEHVLLCKILILCQKLDYIAPYNT